VFYTKSDVSGSPKCHSIDSSGFWGRRVGGRLRLLDLNGLAPGSSFADGEGPYQ